MSTQICQYSTRWMTKTRLREFTPTPRRSGGPASGDLCVCGRRDLDFRSRGGRIMSKLSLLGRSWADIGQSCTASCGESGSVPAAALQRASWCCVCDAATIQKQSSAIVLSLVPTELHVLKRKLFEEVWSGVNIRISALVLCPMYSWCKLVQWRG